MEHISYTSETEFKLSDPQASTKWILNVISNEGKIPGEIAYVFCDDKYLYKMNVEYLDHDTLTDIITFDYTSGNIVSGDVFISIERVKENATQFDVSFEKELSRVMVHGVLHLLGYKDKSDSEKAEMRNKEDFYLSLQP